MTENCLPLCGSKKWPTLLNIYLISLKKVIKNVIKNFPECIDKCRRVGIE